MPSEGQQVYGAQHPPSVKLIKELKASSSSSSGSSLSSSSNAMSSANIGNTYKDFEKKTLDVWDIDDSDTNVNYNSNNMRDFPISLEDSEEIAKKIIKNHKENHDKSTSPKTKTPHIEPTMIKNLNQIPLSKMFSNGPVRALRVVNNTEDTYDKNSASSYSNNLKNPINVNSKSKSNENDGQKQQINELASTLKSSTLTSNSQVPQPEPQIQRTSPTNQLPAKSTNLTNSTNNKNTIQKAFSSIPEMQSASENHTENNFKYSIFVNREKEEAAAKCEKFKQILSTNPINFEELQKACWKGIPKSYRPICWKILSDYLPLKHELQEKTIEQKRNSYWEWVNDHYSSVYLDSHHEMLRQILNDIPRMNPLIPIFQKKIVQNIFQRVLYVWAVRHPGSGYVQGINDLLTPFFTVFLTEISDLNTEIKNVDIESLPEKDLRQVEADSYWCMTKLLERIQENYVFSQPGIQKKLRSLEDLIKRIDYNLFQHLRKNNVEFIQFAFRWMNNLLMREIPLHCTIRLWDTYHAEPFGFSDFHLYVCAAFLLQYSKNILEEKDFQGIMLLLQNLPTRNMKANDIDLLTAEAYKLQVMFANSPSHTAS